MSPDDDYVESPFVESAEHGNDSSYDHTPKKQVQWQQPARDWDDLDVKLGIIDHLPPEPVNTISSASKPIRDAESMELRWAWNQTSNAQLQGQERSRLRYGKLITASQNFAMWGMATWYEAKRHIHANDRAAIDAIWSEIVYEVSQRSRTQGDHRSCIWCVKSNNQTRQGVWAISIETDQQREIFIWNAGNIVTKTLPIKAANKFSILS